MVEGTVRVSEITFDPQIIDPPPGAVITDFHTWLAGQAKRYERRLCSCGCQDRTNPAPERELGSL